MSKNKFLQEIVTTVDLIRSRQSMDGSIQNPQHEDYIFVNHLTEILKQGASYINELSPKLLAAILNDVTCWIQNGLERRPFFDSTLAAFEYPPDGGTFFFLAAMRATNGPQPEGLRIEIVYGIRQETSYLEEASRHTHGYIAPFQCIQLEKASEGFRSGNCIVLFPESVAAVNKVKKQGFALFFFSKFFEIYQNQTLPEIERLFGTGNNVIFESLKSKKISEAETYDARCLWGYYHDYVHHTGIRPLDKNLYIKQNWFTGLLEEVKCDLTVVRLMQKSRPSFWMEIVEFVLFERIFRYPKNSEKNITFDAGTGILIFEIFFKNGVLKKCENGYLEFSPEGIEECINLIIADIEKLEQLPDEDYIAAAKIYVQKHLGLPNNHSERFNFPASQYTKLVQRTAQCNC